MIKGCSLLSKKEDVSCSPKQKQEVEDVSPFKHLNTFFWVEREDRQQGREKGDVPEIKLRNDKLNWE